MWFSRAQIRGAAGRHGKLNVGPMQAMLAIEADDVNVLTAVMEAFKLDSGVASKMGSMLDVCQRYNATRCAALLAKDDEPDPVTVISPNRDLGVCAWIARSSLLKGADLDAEEFFVDDDENSKWFAVIAQGRTASAFEKVGLAHKDYVMRDVKDDPNRDLGVLTLPVNAVEVVVMDCLDNRELFAAPEYAEVHLRINRSGKLIHLPDGVDRRSIEGQHKGYEVVDSGSKLVYRSTSNRETRVCVLEDLGDVALLNKFMEKVRTSNQKAVNLTATGEMLTFESSKIADINLTSEARHVFVLRLPEVKLTCQENDGSWLSRLSPFSKPAVAASVDQPDVETKSEPPDYVVFREPNTDADTRSIILEKTGTGVTIVTQSAKTACSAEEALEAVRAFFV